MKEYDKLYEDLCKSVEPLKKYYNIDKIKSYSVYIWNKSDDIEESENLFDIQSNRIIYYEDVKIIEEAKPIIKKIQKKLQKIKEYLGSDN